jgi:electron transfer flavoprotein beta subunit
MKILVCLKQILDPEIPPRDFKIDAVGRVAEQGSANLVTNIFCENALELALQLREAASAELTTLTFGPAEADEVLRKSLALKVDRAIRLDNPLIERCGSLAVSSALASAIKHIGQFDLIMLGREAGDWGEGQTAGYLAEQLGLPSISFVDRMEISGSQVHLRRQTELGVEQWISQCPLVVSVTNSDSNVPRIPKTRDIMLAHRKSLDQLTLSDVGLSIDALRKLAAATEVVELSVPKKDIQCEMITGDTQADRIERLADCICEVVRAG